MSMALVSCSDICSLRKREWLLVKGEGGGRGGRVKEVAQLWLKVILEIAPEIREGIYWYTTFCPLFLFVSIFPRPLLYLPLKTGKRTEEFLFPSLKKGKRGEDMKIRDETRQTQTEIGGRHAMRPTNLSPHSWMLFFMIALFSLHLCAAIPPLSVPSLFFSSVSTVHVSPFSLE